MRKLSEGGGVAQSQRKDLRPKPADMKWFDVTHEKKVVHTVNKMDNEE